MKGTGKKYRDSVKDIDRSVAYPPAEAMELLKKSGKAKFDETAEISIYLGIDPKRTDQTVRGTVVLPHGTGKTPKIIVFAKGEKAKEAEDAGADVVGGDELIAKVKTGWSEFDLAVATPDMMAAVGSQLGRVLGPRMPNPKAGTVTQDVKKTVKELKSGKIQYRIDKQAIIHASFGKVSFGPEKLLQNFNTLIDAVVRAKPAAAKGIYLKSIYVSSTMGPGIKVDAQKAAAVAAVH